MSMATVESIDEAKALLAEDKAKTLSLIDTAGEETLASKMMAAPWDPTQRLLGH